MSAETQIVRGSDPFAGLKSDFDGGADNFKPLRPLGNGTPTDAQRMTLGTEKTVAKLARFPCAKCGGSGRYMGHSQYGSQCFKCKGRGMMKTDPRAAIKRRQAKEAKRLAEIGQKLAAWAPSHTVELEWIAANHASFDFARSLRDALQQYGCLTENQSAAIHRCIEKSAARAKERAERKPDANVAGAGFSKMVAAFDAAKVSGLKRPKFYVGPFVFAPAKMTSQNAGSIYVTERGQYLGKITAEGGYFAVREATAAQREEIAKIGADPLAAAVLHGQQTGKCSCCGRELENAESVKLGIGPICRKKWGLA